jgi:hypothetical protein
MKMQVCAGKFSPWKVLPSLPHRELEFPALMERGVRMLLCTSFGIDCKLFERMVKCSGDTRASIPQSLRTAS